MLSIALVGASSEAIAQPVTQNLTIGFSGAAGTQSVAQTVPLSTGLTFALMLALAIAAYVALRKGRAGGGRLFGLMLALAAGTTLAVAVGNRAISDAHALTGPVTLINLSVSPAVLNVAPFAPDALVTVKVTNTTGQTVKLTSIVLDSGGPYTVSTPTDCVVGGALAASAQCTITLAAIPG
ncbi:MAG TPA: midcut-by-XrtH protein [Casimicrobiaceae bacterium]|nr:midcut-by-XrtH protein [Casimicrobiaceae bacterium]